MNTQTVNEVEGMKKVESIFRNEIARMPVFGKYDRRLIEDMLENTLGAAGEPVLRIVEEVDEGITAFQPGDLLIVDVRRFTPRRGEIVVDIDRNGAILREINDINAPSGPDRGRRLGIVTDDGLDSIENGTFDVLGTVIRVIRSI